MGPGARWRHRRAPHPEETWQPGHNRSGPNWKELTWRSAERGVCPSVWWTSARLSGPVPEWIRNRLLGVGRQGRWIFGVLFPFQLSEAVESVQDGTSHALGDLVLPRPVPGDFLTLHLLGLSLPSLLVQAECCTRASRILPVLQVHGLRSIGEQFWGFLCRNFLRRKAIHHLNNSFQIDRNDSLMIPFRTFDHRSKIVISEGKGFKPENAR